MQFKYCFNKGCKEIHLVNDLNEAVTSNKIFSNFENIPNSYIDDYLFHRNYHQLDFKICDLKVGSYFIRSVNKSLSACHLGYQVGKLVSINSYISKNGNTFITSYNVELIYPEKKTIKVLGDYKVNSLKTLRRYIEKRMVRECSKK